MVMCKICADAIPGTCGPPRCLSLSTLWSAWSAFFIALNHVSDGDSDAWRAERQLAAWADMDLISNGGVIGVCLPACSRILTKSSSASRSRPHSSSSSSKSRRWWRRCAALAKATDIAIFTGDWIFLKSNSAQSTQFNSILAKILTVIFWIGKGKD